MNFEIVQFDQQDQRCGEIFITSGRNIIFHCTLCQKIFNGFSEYEVHLDEHFLAPDAACIEEVQIKNENFSEIEISLDSSFLEDADSHTIELSKRTEQDFEQSEADINDGTIVKDNDFVSKQKEAENMFSNDETNKCRPVRKKSNYLEQAGELRKYKCHICPAAFKDKSSLRKHIERHTTQKSHQCPKCSKKFYTPFDVKKHLTVHSGDRPFLCTICGKTCLSNSKLKDHMRRHTNERDYKCAYCKKEFYNASLLTEHLQVHTNERRHKCSVCNANFTYRKGLRNHMKLHENKRSYKCELCSASFNQQAGLFSHMKNKHKTA